MEGSERCAQERERELKNVVSESGDIVSQLQQEKLSLEEKVLSAENEVVEMEARLDALNAEKVGTDVAKAHLLKLKQEHKAEMEKLRSAHVEEMSQLEQSSRHTTLSRLASLEDERGEEIEELTAKVKALEDERGEEIEELTAKVKALEEEKKSAKTDEVIAGLQLEKKRAEKVLEKALNRVSSLEKAHGNRDEVAALHVELADARREVAEYAQELLESAQREDEMQQNITDLQQEIMFLIGKIQNLQDYVDEVEGGYGFPFNGTAPRSNGGRMSFDPYEQQSTRERQQRFQRRHSADGNGSSSNSEAFSAAAEKYRNMYNEAAKRCSELEQELLSGHDESNSKTMKAMEDLHEDMSRLQSENQELQRQLYQAKKEAGDSKTSTTAEKFRVMYAESAKRCAELEKELLAGHEVSNAKSVKALEELHEELGQVQAENHDLQRDLYQARKEASDSKMVIQQLELRYQEKVKELQDVRNQLRKVRSSVSDLYGPLQKALDGEEESSV
eukprot:g19298.t1